MVKSLNSENIIWKNKKGLSQLRNARWSSGVIPLTPPKKNYHLSTQLHSY